jgi:hypothetical protein
VIKGGKILAGGHNLVKPGFAGPLSAATTATASGGDETATAHCPRQHGFSMHAEMTAISSALRGERMQGSKVSLRARARGRNVGRGLRVDRRRWRARCGGDRCSGKAGERQMH